jgi:EAL domain-containing protein (putative c-di-GMP-specific phosphodiesterase class I)/GGDEF domain-containing protein
MLADAMTENLPDLLIVLRRDGIVLGHAGGTALTALKPTQNAVGQSLHVLWPEAAAASVTQLTCKAIAVRATSEGRFVAGTQEYEARVSAQGPDRALCVIRAVLNDSGSVGSRNPESRSARQLDRRGFLRRLRESMSWATLREDPLAVAVVHVDGIADIAQLIGQAVAEQVLSTAISRLAALLRGTTAPGTRVKGAGDWWYLGQLGESLLAMVLESSDREAIRDCVSGVCASLREPVTIGQAQFHLTPYAGVALLGQDASAPKILLDHARTAAAEARRGSSQTICFFSEAVSQQQFARLDTAGELRKAIENRDIRLRYIGRHDLATGRLLAWVGYLRWIHPLRGEIRPVEFLRLAETTGLATDLSRCALSCLCEDFQALTRHCDPDVRISFGALRHHVLHEEFIEDIARLLQSGVIPADRLELRIAEKIFIGKAPERVSSLRRLGVQLVVDEVGRGTGSLDRLARAPIWGLQLDRGWVTSLRTDEVARKVCRAGIAMARALELTPIATGVDDRDQRDALLTLGCQYGSGDLYPGSPSDITQTPVIAI